MKQHFSVRDYECDLQGVVNNSIYSNYYEHTRHEYLKTLGINFAELHKKGTDLFLVRSEINFKASLKSGDEFYVTVEFKKESKIKFTAHQQIFKTKDKTLVSSAKFICVAVVKGKVSEVKELYAKIFAQPKNPL